MATLNFYFTTSAPTYKGVLCSCVSINVGGKTKRAYKKVQGFTNPNFNAWDKKQQKFIEPTADAISNNETNCGHEQTLSQTLVLPTCRHF